jgi:hypothetical protein
MALETIHPFQMDKNQLYVGENTLIQDGKTVKDRYNNER